MRGVPSHTLPEDERDELIGTPKHLDNWSRRLWGSPGRSTALGRRPDGTQFHVYGRVAHRIRDFSFGLRYEDGRGNQYMLVRVNSGHAAPHRNALEGSTIPPQTPHVHWCTERYQKADGHREEHFAVSSDEYLDAEEAMIYFADLIGLQHESVERRIVT